MFGSIFNKCLRIFCQFKFKMDRLRKDYFARLEDLRSYLLDIFKQLFANQISVQQVLVLVNERLSDQRQYLLIEQDAVIKTLQQQNYNLRESLSEGRWKRQMSEKDKQLLEMHDLGLKYQQTIEHLEKDSVVLTDVVLKLQAKLITQKKEKQTFQTKIRQIAHQNQLIISNLQSKNAKVKQLQEQLQVLRNNQKELSQQNSKLKSFLQQPKPKKSEYEQAIQNVHKRVLMFSKPDKCCDQIKLLKNNGLELIDQIATLKCQLRKLKGKLSGQITNTRHFIQRNIEQLIEKSSRIQQRQVSQTAQNIASKYQNQMRSVNQRCNKQGQLINLLQQQNNSVLAKLKDQGQKLRILSSQFLIVENQLQYTRQKFKEAQDLIQSQIPGMIAQRQHQALQTHKHITQLKHSLTISNSLKQKIDIENCRLKQSICTIAKERVYQVKARQLQLAEKAGQTARQRKEQITETKKCQLQQLNNIGKIRQRYLRF